jgi:hypothetical protein
MMASLDEEITALKALITQYESMLVKAKTTKDRNIILAAITAKEVRLVRLHDLFTQKSQQGKIVCRLLIRTCYI